MDDRTVSASPELLAANRRLQELRARAQAERQAVPAAAIAFGMTCPQPETSGASAVSGVATAVPRTLLPKPLDPGEGTAVRTPMPGMAADPSPTDAPGLVAIIVSLPAHLGWGSEPLTAVLRRTVAPVTPEPPVEGDTSLVALLAPVVSGDMSPDNPPCRPFVKLYPDIGLAMLRHERNAPGRLWLMLHHLDPVGRGVFRVDIIRQCLTKRNTGSYLCGKRQMRNLLRDGDGLFWTRDKTHVWLHSAVRVAQALGVARLTGRPVALPVSALLEGIGAFRAHLYAAFHSGRARAAGDMANSSPSDKRSMPIGTMPIGTMPIGTMPIGTMPIARDTLTRLSGAGRSSQRAYEARLRLRPQANFAVGETASETNKEERAWHQGQALFELRDYRGEQGKQGKSYLAWQLPNSYGGQHQQRPKGRQKRINRQLRDLVMKGMPGNVETERDAQSPEKRYYPNGRSAGQARGLRVGDERYWRQHKTKNGRFTLWRPIKGG